jgi:predicted Fe-Mo cluster-binding NifX family protein
MKKILFIGNSHTFYNKMPEEIFAPMLISAGIEAEVSSITKGGEYLANHAKSDTVTGQRIDEALANNTYDVIILQEQGKNPIVNFDDFDAAVHTLDKKVKELTKELEELKNKKQ